ncbi:hypothetical protein OG324_31915 [Streptomyces sp. NBC_01236]|nr:hypothetical protein OG324_31915 [Streptomyces sp. NBC_01236]
MRRSLPPLRVGRSCSAAGWAGMASDVGRGRCGSDSAAEGWECSGPGEGGGGVGAPVPEGEGEPAPVSAEPLAQGTAVPGPAGASPLRA